MRNREFVMTGGLILYTIVLMCSVIIALVTFVFDDHSSPFLYWAVSNHLWIMIFMVALSIGYGFFLAWFLGKQIKQQETQTQSILDVVLLFLSFEEKKVLLHLLENQGKSTQAEIARLEKFGGVKALRLVQRMMDKKLIGISIRGKMRDIYLRDELYTILKNEISKIRKSCA